MVDYFEELCGLVIRLDIFWNPLKYEEKEEVEYEEDVNIIPKIRKVLGLTPDISFHFVNYLIKHE